MRILSAVLKKDRSFFYAYPDYELTSLQLDKLNVVLNRRLSGEPLAYIFNHQEFWSLDFYVDQNVLIPRADTECVIEAVLDLPVSEDARVIDLGTGSGAIGVVLAKEKQSWSVFASDVSFSALQVAQKNIDILCGGSNKPVLLNADWLNAIANAQFELVVVNPPYIDAYDKHVAQLSRAEPHSALFSPEQGLSDIKQLIVQGLRCIQLDGWLVMEHGFEQHEIVRRLVSEASLEDKRYDSIQTVKDYSGRCRGIAARVIRF